MYGFINRYLASVFLDYNSLKPEKTIINKLEEAINDPKYICMNTVEFPSPGAVPIQRIGFSASDAGLDILLLGNRFNFTLHPTAPDGKNVISLSDFTKQAGDIFGAILKCLGRKVYRIALVREGLLSEMDNEMVEKIRDRLLNIPPSLNILSPFEWTYRFATRIEREFGGCKEQTNTLIAAIRSDFKIAGLDRTEKKYNSVRVDYDINTIADNVIERFGIEEIKSFFIEGVKWHLELEEGFLTFLREGGYANQE